MALIKELRDDPQSRHAILFLKKAQARSRQDQAVPASVAQMREMIKEAPPLIGRTLAIMWLLLARHGDLIHGRLQATQEVPGSRIQLASILYLPWKSDTDGSKRASKVIPVTEPLLRLLRSRCFATYTQMYTFLKKWNLTVHSIGRGGISYLANKGYSAGTIAILTQHAAGQEGRNGAHRYISAPFAGPTVEHQVRLSSTLWDAIWPQTR